jgi:hypothetical protein
MAIQDDWTINYSAKTVTHSAGATVYSVNALYSWLMDEFDELSQMDDEVPMSAQTPTEYSLINGWTFGNDVEDVKFLSGGAITLVDTANGNDVWANVYSVGSPLAADTQIYIAQNGSVITPWWPTGHIDVLIKVRNNGTLIDSGDLIVYARELGDRYTFFEVNAPSGRQVAAIATENDLNDSEGGGSVVGVVIGFAGPYSVDVDQDGTPESYDVQINCGGNTLADVYEYLKYVTRRGSTTDLGGVQGQQYISADAAYTPIPAAPFGTFAGGIFFGARGVVVTNMNGADTNDFQVIDSAGNVKTPPVSINITVDKVVAGDRVAVFRLTGAGGGIDTTEYTTAAAGNSVGSGTVTVTTAIAADTPASGTIRLGADKKRYAYTSWTGSTFTLSGTLGENRNSTNLFVPLIDVEATGVSVSSAAMTYAADIPALVRVRKKGIQPFEVEATVGSNGATVSAIRTPDSVVTI